MSTNDTSTATLKDVVAFVDVWSSSKTENYSKTFVQQLLEMGAVVSKTFNKQVTHVVFKHGHQSTWDKAKKSGAKLVSVLWVARCKDSGQHVDEELCPAILEDKRKKHRCMQPRDAAERTPENAKRLKQRLDRMMKDLVPLSPVFSDTSPFIIDEESAIVYSPSSRRADAMARRLKEMKEKRENLSPTASQMVESRLSSEFSSKASPGNSQEGDASDHEFGYEDLHGSSRKKDALGGPKTEADFAVNDADAASSMTSLSSAPSARKSAHCDEEKKKPLAESHCLGAFFRGGEITPSAAESNSQDAKSRTSLVKMKRGKGQASTRSLSLDVFFGTSKTTQPLTNCQARKKTLALSPTLELLSNESVMPKAAVKSNENVNVENDCGGPTKLASGNSSSVTFNSPCAPSNHSASTKRSSANRKQTKLSKSRGPPARVACPRKAPRLPSEEGTPGETSGFCPAGDDEAFEDYFSPANRPENGAGRRRGPLWVSLSSEKAALPLFVLEPEPGKRKRAQIERAGSCPAKVKRSRHEAVPSESNSGPGSDFEEAAPLAEGRRWWDSSDAKSSARAEGSMCGTKADVPASSPKGGASEQRRSCNALGLTSAGSAHASEGSGQLTKSQPLPVSRDSEERRSGLVLQRCGTKLAADVTYTSSEMFSKQKTQDKEGSVKKDKKATRTLVMTSMPTEKQHTVIQVVGILGGFSVVDTVCESTTHVVAGSPRRTVNVLLGIARGCWILSFEWILWCLEQRQWIPEEPYELSDHFPAAPICRLQQHLSAGEHQQDLFSCHPAMFVSPQSQPPAPSLAELIQLCGGTVCKTVRQAGICIGEYWGKKPQGTKSLSEKWVLDCLTHLKRLPYENYDLEWKSQ